MMLVIFMGSYYIKNNLEIEQLTKELEKDTLYYLVDEKGYDEIEFALIESGYDHIGFNYKEYFVKVVFKDEPNQWYLYGYKENKIIYQIGSSNGGKHVEELTNKP